MIATMGAAIAAAVLAVSSHVDLTWKVKGPPPNEPTPIELCAANGRATPIEAATTVRIWNQVGNGSSGGSGTVVGNDGRRSLVLTCDHIYGDGVGTITIKHGGRSERGWIVARDRGADISLVVTSSLPGPVATIERHEATRGDRVTLSGYGGGNRGFMLRVGPARGPEWVGALSQSGDSGGGAFVRGRLVGVLVGHELNDETESMIVPIRRIVALAAPVHASQQGRPVYQRWGDVTLTGLFRGLFGGSRYKQKQKGRCGPGGCPPGFPGGGGAGPGNIATPPGSDSPVWYAPGFGPNDPGGAEPLPIVPPGDRPAPEPPPVVPPGSTIDIDLSGFIQRPEFQSVVSRIDGLATKADIEIVISRVGQVEEVVTRDLTAVDKRLTVLETPATPDPVTPEPDPQVHWVLVADWRSPSWERLRVQVDTARSAGVVVASVDANRISGIVASPQLVRYEDGRPSTPITGERSVALELQRIARGG
ncbi:MAG: serine protease [Planctomycetota bacterium]|nr:serine protease [Planctomycetota bacterium]